MNEEQEAGSEENDWFGSPRLSDLLNYRKVAIAVVACYVGLDRSFVAAVLRDEMDEYLQAREWERERLKEEKYADYVSLLSKEIIVRYAATAGETLAVSPESPMARAHRVMGDTGDGLGLTDDVNAVVRIHELFEYLESPDASDEAESILLATKRYLCHYYNACAFSLVKGPLLPVIIQAAEQLYRGGTLTPEGICDLIIAAENDASASNG